MYHHHGSNYPVYLNKSIPRSIHRYCFQSIGSLLLWPPPCFMNLKMGKGAAVDCS